MDLRLTRLNLRTLLRSLSDLLMPRECAVCGRQLLPRERHLCLECEADLPLTHFDSLAHNPMADAFNARVEAPHYVRAAALFYYTGDYQNITRALKYHRNFALGRRFARMLGEELAAVPFWEGVDAVCPVPLHWTRRFSRGYNQADVIGRELAGALDAAFAPRLLRRTRRTGTQTRLSSAERAVNVSGAFCARPSPDSPGHILLVDDVFTTGATLAACYTALRSALGPSVRISVATLAYVESSS